MTVVFIPVKDYIKNHDTIKNRKISYSFFLDNDMFRFNRDKNLLILVLDSFGDTLLEDIFADKKYKDIFKDFIRYSNYSAAYPYTPPSGLSFLANTVYDNIDPLFEIVDTVLSTDKNLQVYLKNKGWIIKQYGTSFPYYVSPDLQDNVAGVDMKSVYENDYKNLANIVLFRIMPSFLKPYFSQNLLEETAQIKTHTDDGYTIKNKEWDMWFYDTLTDIEISYSDKPVFFFAHLKGAHAPWRVDSDININKDGVDIIEQAKASLILVDKFINKLKLAGMYDNTVMIITSDHGHGANLEFGRANPIMLVKEIGGGNVYGELITNNSPISQWTFTKHLKAYLDVQGTSLSKLQDTNPRRYYRCANGVNGFYGIVEEYSVPQQIKDIDSFRLLRTITPGSAFISSEKRFIFSGNYGYDKKIFSDFAVRYNGLAIQSSPPSIITFYFDDANEFYKIEMKFGLLQESNVLKFYTNGSGKIVDFGDKKEKYWTGYSKHGSYTVRFSDVEKGEFVLKEVNIT
ncbi:MAG: LTA synthase family protein, partial [Mucispirillum sp.]|nr:LTA synthase family protein [Mucispirillum sp.]